MTEPAGSAAEPPGGTLPLDAIEVGGRRLEYADLPAPGFPPAPLPRSDQWRAGTLVRAGGRTSGGAGNPGGGPAVVLVHGGNCTADDWARGSAGAIAPRLARRYRLILPDGLVHPLDPWLIWRLLDHLGIQDASLVGHSAGGLVVAMMYRQQPHRVRSLVSIDSQGVGQTIVARLLPNDRFSPHAAALYEQRKEEMLRLKPEHQGDYASEVNIAHRLVAYQRARMTPEERARTRPAPRSVRTLAAAPPAPEPIPAVGKFITCPLLVIHTGRGKLGPEDISAAWVTENIQATDVDYVVIREASHWPWHEQPEWFLSHLEPFLTRTSAPPTAVDGGG